MSSMHAKAASPARRRPVDQGKTSLLGAQRDAHFAVVDTGDVTQTIDAFDTADSVLPAAAVTLTAATAASVAEAPAPLRCPRQISYGQRRH